MSEHTLTILRCNGLVVQGSPLDPQPLKVQLFGKPDAPIQRELIDVREVDALLSALAPHAHALCSYAGGSDVPRLIEAVASMRSLFEPAPEKPRLVLQ